ncbi:hypothetical protein TEK04_14865 [Klenkia sp. LSe6-5]|uniref:Uncharacterized protein n=1 Tax=Klenkia sesuvii TaxID=3103137 RepID=A0ABU8DVY0_9ACTN
MPSVSAAPWPVVLVLVVVMVVGSCWLMELALRWFTGTLSTTRLLRRRAPRRARRRPGRRPAVRRPAPAPVPVRRPVEAVAADLRRLRAELALVTTGSAARRAGVLAAYDDVLVEAADALEVPHVLRAAAPGEAREVERLRLADALAAAGLVTGGPGARG